MDTTKKERVTYMQLKELIKESRCPLCGKVRLSYNLAWTPVFTSSYMGTVCVCHVCHKRLQHINKPVHRKPTARIWTGKRIRTYYQPLEKGSD